MEDCRACASLRRVDCWARLEKGERSPLSQRRISNRKEEIAGSGPQVRGRLCADSRQGRRKLGTPPPIVTQGHTRRRPAAQRKGRPLPAAQTAFCSLPSPACVLSPDRASCPSALARAGHRRRRKTGACSPGEHARPPKPTRAGGPWAGPRLDMTDAAAGRVRPVRPGRLGLSERRLRPLAAESSFVSRSPQLYTPMTFAR